MKKINSNLGTWILSSVGGAAVVASIIVSLPTISKAAVITVSCSDGSTITCNGTGCKGADNSGCECVSSDGSSEKKTCPTVRGGDGDGPPIDVGPDGVPPE